MNRSDEGTELAELCAPRGRHGHRAGVVRGVAKRGLVAFLAFAMAFSTTPAQMWADGAEGIAQAVTQTAEGDGNGQGASSGQSAATSTDADNATAGTSASGDASAAGETSAVNTTEGSASSVAAEQRSASAGNGAASQQSQDSVSAQSAEDAKSSATTLTSAAKVLIQSSKDYDSTYSQKYGTLKTGDVLWANMYDDVETEDYWGDPTTETKSVANPGTWTYTWLAADSKGYTTDAYTQELGHGQSLTITSDMAGKYIICKVTAGGKDYYAPASTYDGSFNSNYIPGPVLGEGQVDLYKVELSSTTPSVDDTLTATAYTSYYQQAPAGTKLTYKWYSSTSQYSGFKLIEGQTSSKLVVTSDLAGKFIKVEASAGVNTVSKATSSKVKLAGEVEIYAVSIVNTKDDSSVFTVGDTAKARAREKDAASGVFVDASKLNYQWESCDTQSGTYADIPGATSETLVLDQSLSGKYIKCKVSSKIGASSRENSSGAVVAPAGSLNITSVAMTPASGKVEVGSTVTAKATTGDKTDVTNDSHVKWQWYKGTSSYASSCTTPIEGETGSSIKVTAALKGCYIVAKANGGFGEKSQYYAVGPVSVAGQVELYDVQFEGSYDTSGLHVGDVIKTKVRKADGSSYSYLGRTDNVSYQWQYAETNTTSDNAFKDIPGATGANYTVEQSYVGKYIRVKVTSENTVVSTKVKSSYGGTTSKNPLGPVSLKGQYTLKSIAPDEASATTLNVGAKLTPRIKIPGSSSWSDRDLPEDAELTMAWYASEDGENWTEITDGIDTTDGSLTVSSALAGRRLKVTASALDNTVEWVSPGKVLPAGQYDLLRVIATPQINSTSTTLVTGDKVSATAFAKRADGSSTNGIDVTKDTTISWYVAKKSDASAGDWTKLEDTTGASIEVPEVAAGKYLKAVATSGDSTVELVSANAVVAHDSLAGAIQKLTDANPSLSVAYSKDGGNVNDALKAELKKLGYSDIDVKVSEGGVTFDSADPKTAVGISDAQDKTNGDVTYFFIDPNEYSGWNIDGLRRADVVFELTRGDETDYYQPDKKVSVAWDEAKLRALLDQAAENLQITYQAGESADSVTGNITLPYQAGSNNKYSVSWKSSDTGVVNVTGYGWSNYTGKVTRVSSDRTVELTATVKLTSGGPDGFAGTHTFKVTVKGDPDKVEADKKVLQKKVDKAFTYDNVKYSGTDTVADKDGLTDDLQMPTTKTLDVDGKYYEVKYSANNDDVTFNGYKGTVYRPEPGKDASDTKIALTVTDKSNSEVTATKTLDYKVKPFEQADLDNDLKLMEAAKAGYAQAILNGQDANSVTGNMHAFQKAYFDADGNLAWTYDRDATDKVSGGIVPVELPGYDSMSGQAWRLFKTSDTSVISAENLLVTQPEYNTKVTITSRLSSEKYARYAERYPDNATYAKLANQEVAATVIVKGTSGQQAPEVSSTCSVIGVDKDGKQQTWAAAQNITLKNGATAADLSEQFFSQNGLNASYNPRGSWGWVLNWIVSPFDSSQKLGYDAKTGKYWQLFINGKASSLGAGNYTLEEGDSVVWAYSAWGDKAPTDSLSVSCEIVGQDKSGNQESWAIPTTIDMPAGSTAGDLTDALFKQVGITASTGNGSWGWYLNSITSPKDKSNTLSTEQVGENSWKYWQFFVNGKMANVGAGNYELKAGDKISWVYGSDGAMPGQISASMEIIGQKDGKAQRWTDASNQVFLKGTTLKDATAAYFDALGIENKMFSQFGYWGVTSIVSPLDGTELSGKWTFFVNGMPGSKLDENYVLQAGDKVVWAYDAGDKVPDPDEVIVDPSAKRPTDLKADWDGKSDAAADDVSTPAGAAASEWTFDYKAYAGSQVAYASEPIIVNGDVYLAVNKRLLKIDSQTGKVKAEANLKTTVGYTSRPVYSNGLIIVPLDGGAVQALTADALTTVWVTDPVSDTAQSNSTLTVDGDYVYVGTVDVDWSTGTYNNGHLLCINMLTGAVAWDNVNKDEGYYWDGATVVGDYILMPTMSGTVELLNKSTGAVVSSVSLNTTVCSSCVVSQDGAKAYLVSRDGLLYVFDIVSVDQGGIAGQAANGGTPSLKLEKTVNLGLTGCGCYPTVCGDTMYIGGEVSNGSALAMVNLDDLSTKLITTADGAALPAGGIKGAPLVTTQNGKTRVYFTVNYGDTSDYVNYTSGGGVYSYEVGSNDATSAFSAAGHYDYCDSPVACDKQGNLYYINDSGTLFKLTSGIKVSFDTGEGSFVASGSALKDGKLIKPADPTRKGYTFGGWFTDAACQHAFDFNSVVTSAFTLYAKWNPVKSDDLHKGDNSGSNGGNGGNGGTVDNDNVDNNGADNGTNSGSGTAGRQAGGSVAATHKAVSSKAEGKKTSGSKSSDDKKSDKDSKSSKSDKKKGGSSAKGSSSDSSSSEATRAAKGTELDTGFGVDAVNPLAIAGIAVGVVGLAVIVWYAFGRRRGNHDVR